MVESTVFDCLDSFSDVTRSLNFLLLPLLAFKSGDIGAFDQVISRVDSNAFHIVAYSVLSTTTFKLDAVVDLISFLLVAHLFDVVRILKLPL